MYVRLVSVLVSFFSVIFQTQRTNKTKQNMHKACQFVTFCLFPMRIEAFIFMPLLQFAMKLVVFIVVVDSICSYFVDVLCCQWMPLLLLQHFCLLVGLFIYFFFISFVFNSSYIVISKRTEKKAHWL